MLISGDSRCGDGVPDFFLHWWSSIERCLCGDTGSKALHPSGLSGQAEVRQCSGQAGVQQEGEHTAGVHPAPGSHSFQHTGAGLELTNYSYKAEENGVQSSHPRGWKYSD